MKILLICLVLMCLCCKGFADPIVDAVNAYMQKNNIPGIALAVVQQDKSYISTFGLADLQSRRPITPETLFRIASITKVFTALELAIQVTRGRMHLQDPLVKYMPRLQHERRPIQQVTLEQLATHTSSLQRDPPNRSNLNTLVNFLRQWQPNTPIGTHYLYSNLGFGLLGLAIAHAEHLPYGEVLQRDIFHPLGMTSTQIQHHGQHLPGLASGYKPNGTLAPAIQVGLLPGGGALISNANDMLKFLKANLGMGNSPALAQAIQLTHKNFFRANDHLTLGLAWQKVILNGNLALDKNGGLPGFSSYIGFIPDKKIGVVILANKAKINSTLLGRRLLKILLKQAQK